MAGWTKFHLNEKQYEELLFAEKQVKKPQLLKKIQCIKLKNKGREHKKVGDFLEITIQTVSVRTKAYLKGGIKELLLWKYKGKVTVLTSKILEEIRKKNREKPFDTAKEAMNFIERKYGIKFSLHYVQKLIKKNFSFHIKSKK